MNSITIFIIDDEPIICKSISFALRKSYLIKTFSDAESAINAMKDQMPDIILLDITLPGMNGIEALEKIRLMYPHVCIIMVSASEDEKTVSSALKMGAQSYLCKPFHLGSLKSAIKNLMNPQHINQMVPAC